MGLLVSPVAGMVDTGCTVGAAVGCTVGCAVRRGCSAACGAVVGCAVGDAVGVAVGGVVGWGSLAVTVAALVISLVAAASEKYLPQPSQYQYAMLPSSAAVAAFASMCFRSVWLFGSRLP